MDFHRDPELETFRQEIRAFLSQEFPKERRTSIYYPSTPMDAASAWAKAKENLEWDKAFYKKLGQRGWLGIYWPKEYGGGGKTVLHHFVLVEEFTRTGAPFPVTAVGMVGPTILRYGTEEQKLEWLPRITAGEIEFTLGYSEPHAGTDLASLETRAVLDGDEFVINGTKIFNSQAHASEYEWLAVRTDPNAPKHRGISLIIVQHMTSPGILAPGITVSPLWTMGDYRTNQTYFENVRVPRQNLIGEMNRGWYYVATALDYERIAVFPLAGVRAIFDELVSFVRETSHDGHRLADDPAVRSKIAQLSIEIEVGQMFTWNNAWLVSQHVVPNYEASMLKIFNTELLQRVCHWGTQVLGLYGQLQEGSKWAPLQGRIEREHRAAVMPTFGGGSNEIQRNIIALRGLGLPRG